MKTLKIYASILMILTLTTSSYSQDQTLALAREVRNIAAPAGSSQEITVEKTVEPVAAEDEEPTFEVSGSIDTYFRSGFGYKSYAPATSFANQKGFGLGMANLVFFYGGEKLGFTADLVFGPRGQDAVFNSSQGIVNQLFVYYKVSDKITLNMGQFNTFLGYEVISPTVNFHYSSSYMFSYGPFSHTGLRADIDLGGGFVGKLAVLNPTDLVEFNPVNTYTLGAQFGHESEAGGIWLNVLYGDQDGKLAKSDYPYVLDDDGNIAGFLSSGGSLFQVDITTGFNLSEKFYLGLNTSYQSIASGEQFVSEGDIQDIGGDATSFFGVALYPNVKLSEAFAMGARVEYFSVKKNHLEGVIGLKDGDGTVTAFTVSANYKTGPLTIIPEFRLDKTSEDFFLDKNYNSKDMLSSFTLAAVYKF
jgi:hypothetical protein